jgi:hypothetical protein
MRWWKPCRTSRRSSADLKTEIVCTKAGGGTRCPTRPFLYSLGEWGECCQHAACRKGECLNGRSSSWGASTLGIRQLGRATTRTILSQGVGYGIRGSLGISDLADRCGGRRAVPGRNSILRERVNAKNGIHRSKEEAVRMPQLWIRGPGTRQRGGTPHLGCDRGHCLERLAVPSCPHGDRGVGGLRLRVGRRVGRFKASEVDPMPCLRLEAPGGRRRRLSILTWGSSAVLDVF